VSFVGRLVHYKVKDNCLAAIITKDMKTTDLSMTLVVFTADGVDFDMKTATYDPLGVTEGHWHYLDAHK